MLRAQTPDPQRASQNCFSQVADRNLINARKPRRGTGRIVERATMAPERLLHPPWTPDQDATTTYPVDLGNMVASTGYV